MSICDRTKQFESHNVKRFGDRTDPGIEVPKKCSLGRNVVHSRIALAVKSIECWPRVPLSREHIIITVSGKYIIRLFYTCSR
jgi:hypothetical protein